MQGSSSNRHGLLIIATLSCALLGSLYGATSCIFPNDDPQFLCGIRWNGEATGAHAEGGGVAAPVLEDGDFVVWHECFTPAQNEVLDEGDDANCHLLHDDQASCTTPCAWVPDFEVNGRTTAVCLFDSQDFQDSFRLLAESLAARCEAVAEGQGLDPYPCEDRNEASCAQVPDICEFDGTSCVALEDTCTNAAAKTDPVSFGDPCVLPADGCADTPAGTGGGGDGSGGDGDGSGGDGDGSGGDSTGEGAGETFGDLGALIECFDEDTCFVQQELIDNVIANPTGFLDDTARLRAHKKAGEVVGLRLTGVRPNSLAERLLFHNGDIVTSVNEMPLTNEVELVDAAAAIIDADDVLVTVQRDGKVREQLYVRD